MRLRDSNCSSGGAEIASYAHQASPASRSRWCGVRRRSRSGSCQDCCAHEVIRGTRAVVILLAVLWLGAVFQLHPGALAANDTMLTRTVRGVLRGIVVILAADLLWQLVKAYIDRRLESTA